MQRHFVDTDARQYWRVSADAFFRSMNFAESCSAASNHKIKFMPGAAYQGIIKQRMRKVSNKSWYYRNILHATCKRIQLWTDIIYHYTNTLFAYAMQSNVQSPKYLKRIFHRFLCVVWRIQSQSLQHISAQIW